MRESDSEYGNVVAREGDGKQTSQTSDDIATLKSGKTLMMCGDMTKAESDTASTPMPMPTPTPEPSPTPEPTTPEPQPQPGDAQERPIPAAV